MLERNDGPLRDEEMLRLFREIMSACLAQQEPLKGRLSGAGRDLHANGRVSSILATRSGRCHSTRSTRVFQEVESGAADFGVVPIENSTEGSVNNTLDMFLTSPLKIGGEIELRIEQHLLGRGRARENRTRLCA